MHTFEGTCTDSVRELVSNFQINLYIFYSVYSDQIYI